MIDLVRRHAGSSVALVDGASGAEVTYAELLAAVDGCAEAFAKRPLVFLAPEASKDTVVAFLACLAAKAPMAMVEPEVLPLYRLNSVYHPDLLVIPAALQPPPGVSRRAALPGCNALAVYEHDGEAATPVHEALQLLLSTSGSTGNPKMVRLTAGNLSANASSIVQYLGLTPAERAMQSLPLQYSYGLSVLCSHLAAGATFVLSRHSFLQPEFWRLLDEQRCTSFAGVPFMYQTLYRLRWEVRRHRSIRTLTQAGGGLRPDLIAHFHRAARHVETRFFVMYGQTEATARIAYVPADRLHEKLGAIGVPIPGGSLSISEDELVYRGPNVMMGYASGRKDLALGDVLNGVLATGDLAKVDAEGFYTLIGRKARIAKIFGLRIQLEDVERDLEAEFPLRVAAFERGGPLVVVAESSVRNPTPEATIQGYLCTVLRLPPSAILVRYVPALPRTSVGKVDYRALEE